MKDIKITISEDKLEAKISIAEGEEEFPSGKEIYNTIRKAGVLYGENKQVITKIISDRHPVNEMIFATGKPPIKGENAKLVWYLNLSSSSKPMITAHGKADFKQIRQFTRVKKGQSIVSKLPPTDGEGGKNVMGETIFSAGEDIILPSGNNAIISADGLTLCSKIDGYVFLKSGKVHVDNVYHIKGDVDFSTGNVKFVGKILIEGDVRSGFRVEATDSIYIKGNVGASDIYSQRGDVIVQLGILGKGRAKILAGGGLRSGFIQDATVSVKKDVVIKHYLINSSIFSGEKVILLQNEGLIRGGKTFGDQGIEVLEVGSIKNIPTELGIGGDNYYKVDSEKLSIKEIEDLELRLSLLNKKEEFLKLFRERVISLSAEKCKELEEIGEKIKNLKTHFQKFESQKKSVDVSINILDHDRSIKVRGKLYKGVTIAIGHAQYYVENVFQGVEIYRNGEEILIEKMLETKG